MSSFSFGSPRAPTPAAGGFSFGATSTPAASLSFGSAPAAQPAATGFSFGTPTAQPTAQPATTGFSFGAAPAASTAAPATTGFSFGSNTAPTLGGAAASAFGAFKPTGAAAPTLSFGQTPGQQQQQQPPSLFGQASAQQQQQQQQPPSLFGQTPGQQQPPSLFGQASAQQQQPPSLFGAPSTQPQGLLNLSSTATSLGASLPATVAPAPAPIFGLGGVDINANQPKTVEGKQDGTKAREAQLPQEIAATIETLKAHIKQQKTISSDIARTSQRRLNYVATETQNVKSTLSELADAVESNCASIKALRAETGQVIHHAEMAQRTHETPPGLQFENTVPLMYFAELVHKFENDMIAFKNQVELTEKHMRSLANPQSFTGQDLKHGLQQIHECFIALAGRHHEIHQKVEAQKGLYLKLRKYFLNDRTDVFAEEERKKNAASGSSGGVGVGPTPFSNLLLTLPHSPQNQNQSAVGQGPQMGGNGLSAAPSFGTTQTTTNFSFGNQTGGGFDLQKPPLGGKRNKAFF